MNQVDGRGAKGDFRLCERKRERENKYLVSSQCSNVEKPEDQHGFDRFSHLH